MVNSKLLKVTYHFLDKLLSWKMEGHSVNHLEDKVVSIYRQLVVLTSKIFILFNILNVLYFFLFSCSIEKNNKQNNLHTKPLRILFEQAFQAGIKWSDHQYPILYITDVVATILVLRISPVTRLTLFRQRP